MQTTHHEISALYKTKTITSHHHTSSTLSQVASLKITCDRAEALERENAALEQDNRRLKKLADTAQNAALRLGTLEQEQRQLDQENLELRRQLEALKPASARLAQLQQEYEEMEREREDTQRTLEELRTQAKRCGQRSRAKWRGWRVVYGFQLH